MYTFSKHLFDLYAASRGYLSRILGLKYFNVFGPNEDHKGHMRSMVHKAYQQIVETGRVQLFKSERPEFADGHRRRDFLTSRCRSRRRCAWHRANRCFGLLNVGSGRAQTWLDLVRPVFQALGRPEQIDFIEMPLELRAKYRYSTCASLNRLRRADGAHVVTPLSDAVTECVRDYLVPHRRLGEEVAPAVPGGSR